MSTKRLLLIAFVMAYCNVNAQDTTANPLTEASWQNYVNTIDMNEGELSQEGAPSPSSLLLAGRNYFLNVYGFSFFNVRFRQRGYENFPGRTYVNGVPINSLETNSVQYGMFSGLGNVFRVGETSEQLAASDFSFGGLGNHFSLNTSPTNQRNKLKVGYTFSNRSYQHRLSAVYNNGYTQTGWNYMLAFNLRYRDKGYYPGTYYRGLGYLVSVEKKFKRNVLSLAIWGSDYETGRQSAAVKETFELAGTHFYNPQWGLQNGKSRNASVLKNYLPTATINYKANYQNRTYWNTGLGVTIGDVAYSGLEWYNAPDPRPDYYRYLPSFYKNDNYQYDALTNAIKENSQRLQIDWDKMYTINSAQESGRALYAFGSRHTHHFQVNAASTISAILNDKLRFNGGLEYQWMKLRYYKSLDDLLGGQYWLNVNAFVERDNPSDISTIQNDIDHPNEKILVGDKYSYDYSFAMQRLSEWAQLNFSTRKWDAFASLELNTRQLYRIGYVRNGLFPKNSLGNDPTATSLLFNGKIGTTYKIDGRKYIFLNASLMQQPAAPNTMYVSPATRNIRNDSIGAVNIQTIELGFVMNTPSFKMQANTYFTMVKHTAEYRYFYDDVSQNFASYRLLNIEKKHYGLELSADWKFLPNWNYSFVSSFSKSLYNNRPQLIVTSETSAEILSTEQVYLRNFHIPNTPQTIVHNGMGYRNGGCFFTWDVNAFFNRWSAMNPIRRTNSLLEDINPVSQKDLIGDIVRQEKLPNGYTIDLFGGYSFQLKNKDYKKRRYIDLLLSGNNLLDNKNIIAYAYEQMRLDLKGYDLNKFPNKYSYAMGRNYSVNVAFRF